MRQPQVTFARRTPSGRYVNYSHDNLSRDDLDSELGSVEFMNYTVHIPPTPDNQPMDPSISQRVEEQYVSNSLFTGGFNSVTRAHLMDKVTESETSHPQMAGAKGSACQVHGCDGKVMSDERGADILPCECDFKICRDCYIDAVKGGEAICPGCKEPYKHTDLDEKAVDSSGRRLPLPPSKQDRRMSLMKSTKSGYMRNQTGGAEFDHNRWLFETKGTYGYGNAIWPKEGGYGNGGGGGGGGGDGSSGIIHHTPPLLPGLDSRVPQRPLDFTSSNLFAGGGVGSATTFLSPHHPIIPLIPSFQHPQPHHHPHPHPQQLLLLSDHHQHQIGWGYVNQRTALSAAAGCSSSMSPSSSSSMPQAMPGQGAAASLLTSPFTPAGSSVDAVDSEFRFIHPPPRRPHSGIWFALQASLHQSKEPFLPQLSKRFLRIKDGRMTVRLVMKYVANKLGLDSESEVEIRCRGQQVVPFLTLQHVRDNIWSQRDAAVTLLPDASTSDHVMVLNYGRSSSSNNITISSTYT